MNESYDIIVIGGGASGLMAAIAASEKGNLSVAILERNKRCGLKILISGGNRCNVTNTNLSPGHYYGGNKNFIRNVLRAFDNQSALRFFNSLGVEFYEEEAGKYFPKSNDSRTVLDALLKKAVMNKVTLLYGQKVERIKFLQGGFSIITGSSEFACKKVILAAGGSSFPRTGSDGCGYSIAKALGHKIVDTSPALSPILHNDKLLKSLSGIVVDAELSVQSEHTTIALSHEALLFTHTGISGPAAMNVSRELGRVGSQPPALLINFLPGQNSEKLTHSLRDAIKSASFNSVITYFRELLPAKLCAALFEKAGVPISESKHNLSKEKLNELAQVFTRFELAYTGIKGFEAAEATAGGVSLNEVKYQTMESKLHEGLYFTGEVLDVDGMIGGYNFQWAWSTGHIAGKNAAASLCRHSALDHSDRL